MNAGEKAALREVRSLGWRWHDNGVVVGVAMADGQVMQVFVPLRKVRVTFGREMAAVGCPLQPAVGDNTAVGFLGGLIKAAGRAVKSVARGAGRIVSKGYKRFVPKAIRKAAKKVYRVARKGVRLAYTGVRKAARLARSPVGRAILGAVTTAVPVLAPATGAIAAASMMVDRIDRGVRVANRVQRGLRPTRRQRRQLRKALRARRATEMVLSRARAGDVGAQRFAGALRHLFAGAR